MTARIALPARPYGTPQQVNAFFTALLDRIRAIPGVTSAGIIRALPIGTTIGDRGVAVDGYTPPVGQGSQGDWQVATDGALEALGERLIRGRFFTAADTLDERAGRARQPDDGREVLAGTRCDRRPVQIRRARHAVDHRRRHRRRRAPQRHHDRDQAEVLPAVPAVVAERRLSREHRHDGRQDRRRSGTGSRRAPSRHARRSIRRSRWPRCGR